MAQLRDTQTSELIADGDPLELVLLADSLGLKVGVIHKPEDAEGLEVMLDDVGRADVNAIRAAHTERIEVLERLAADTKLDKADRDRAARQRDERRELERAAKDAARGRDVRKRLDEARARRGRA